MIYIIIYLIGYVLAYYLSRKQLRKAAKEDYDWECVFLSLIASLLSWVWLAVMIVSTDCFPNFPKPPKFL